MTHSTSSLERESFGSLKAFIHTIDITSLDSAGEESYDPSGELNVNQGDNYGVHVVGQEDESKFFAWDHVAETLHVQEVTDTGDGTGGYGDVANNTDCGEVRLLVVGV